MVINKKSWKSPGQSIVNERNS